MDHNIIDATSKGEKFHKMMQYIIMVCLGTVLFIPPFLNGLYYETPTIYVGIFVFLTFILYCIKKITVKQKIIPRTIIDWSLLALTVVYFISVFMSIQKRNAVMEWMKYAMCLAVLLMISDLLKNNVQRRLFLWLITIPAILLCVIAYDGISGSYIVNGLNSFLTSIGVTLFKFTSLSRYGRISSVFQYPNAFAGYLMGIFFVLVGLSITAKKVFERLIAGAFMFIVSITFILTVSRGAYIVMAFAIFLLLLSLPAKSRINAVLNFFTVAIIDIIILIPIYEQTVSQNISEIKLAIFLLIGSVCSAVLFAISSIITEVFVKINKRVYIIVSVVLLVVLIAGSYITMNVQVPLSIAKNGDITGSNLYATKSVYLEQEKEYELVYSVNAYMSSENENAFVINIRSLNEKQVNFGGSSTLITVKGMPSNGIETRKINFKVPEDSRKIEIDFICDNEGTSATFYSAVINSSWTGNKIKDISLKYKYIPDFIIKRIENMNLKDYDAYRSIYIKDGLKILRDYWLTGAGGGAWALLYLKYQSFDYTSMYAHNYFLEIAIDTGILGIIAILMLFGSLLYHLAKNFKMSRKNGKENNVIRICLLVSIIAILMHSAVDFDYALGAILLLIWELVGIYSSYYVNENEFANNKNKGKFSALLKNIIKQKLGIDFSNANNKVTFKLKDIFKIPVIVNPIAILTIAVVVSLLPISFSVAQALSWKASDALKNNNREYAKELVDAAANIDFLNPIHRIDAINLIFQEGINAENIADLKNRIYKLGLMVKNNPFFLPTAAKYNVYVGNLGDGLTMAARSTDIKPFDTMQWQARADSYYTSIIILAEMYDYENVFAFIDDMLKMTYELQEFNKKNISPTMFTTETKIMLERMQFLSDNRNNLMEIDLNKIAFYNISYMDVDNNGIPDQWTVTGKDIALNVLKQDANTTIVNYRNSSQEQYITSRELSLTPGKIYSIEINTGMYDPDKYINYMITGLMNEYGTIVFNGENKYVAEFSIPEDAQKDAKYALRLKFNESVRLKSVLIIEK